MSLELNYKNKHVNVQDNMCTESLQSSDVAKMEWTGILYGTLYV